MKRIGILTAGGDTPALNATIQGAVLRACECRVEVFGFIKGFSSIDRVDANDFRDRYGLIHSRQVHPSFYDVETLRPSRMGVDYLVPIFSHALGTDDMEAVRQTLFRTSNLTQPYHSVNIDINKRICFLD